MHKEFSKREKLELFFNRDGALAGSRLLTGIGLGLAMLAGGTSAFAWTTAAVVGTTALNAYALRSVKNYRKRLALGMYREEIASVQQKPVSDLTLQDLDEAARPVADGGKGIIALQKALELIDEKEKVGVYSQLTTTGIMLGALGLVLAAPGVAEFIPLVSKEVLSGMVAVAAGASGLFYNELSKVVDSVTNITFGMDEKKTVTRDVREIADQVGLGGRVSSTRVFGVFVEASNTLQTEIKEKYGDDYFDLTIAQRRKAVKQYDSQYGLYQLTANINAGCINPPELAFLAYGQRSGIEPCLDAPDPNEWMQKSKIAQQIINHKTARDVSPKLSARMEEDARTVFAPDEKRRLFTERLFSEEKLHEARQV